MVFEILIQSFLFTVALKIYASGYFVYLPKNRHLRSGF